MVEAHNSQGEMFGVPRLQTCLEDILQARMVGKGFSPQVVEVLLAQLAEFTGEGWEQEDDVTFVVVSNGF